MATLISFQDHCARMMKLKRQTWESWLFLKTVQVGYNGWAKLCLATLQVDFYTFVPVLVTFMKFQDHDAKKMKLKIAFS